MWGEVNDEKAMVRITENPWRPGSRSIQLEIEYSTLSGTLGTNHSPGGEKLEDSNSILILF